MWTKHSQEKGKEPKEGDEGVKGFRSKAKSQDDGGSCIDSDVGCKARLCNIGELDEYCLDFTDHRRAMVLQGVIRVAYN